ncbi:MAG: OmpA family protein [Rhizobacter sp.]|nr:OmpA family protein [Rhizobacter sp.]
MNDQNDDAQNYALMVLAGVVALVVAGVMALAMSTTMADKAKVAVPVAVTAAVADGAPTAAVAGDPDGRVYFESGSDALPAEATEVLAKVADAARAQAGKVVLSSGFPDASGDADKNAELAKNRALAVRHALEANGVAPDHLVMDKPVVMTDGADARLAHRVELSLR